MGISNPGEPFCFEAGGDLEVICLDLSNATAITSPEGEITSPEGEITSPESEITSPEGEITSPEGEITSPESAITSPEGEITSPKGEITSPEGEITSEPPPTSPDAASAEVDTRITCTRALMSSCNVTNCKTENCDAEVNDFSEVNGKTTWRVQAVVGTSCTVKRDGLEFTTECELNTPGNGGLWTYPQALEEKCGPQFGTKSI